MKSSISAKIPTELYEAVQEAIKQEKYTSNTECIIKGLNLLLRNPDQENTEEELLLQEKEKEVKNLQEEVNRSKEEVRVLHEEVNRSKENSLNQIKSLEESLSKAPDLVEFAQLQARYEGLQEIIRQKDEMIYILKQTNETLNTFAHYFKSLEVKQIEAQDSKPAAKTENKPAARKEESGQQIEKICKNCNEPFFTGNIKKETCSSKCRSAYSRKMK